MLCYTQVHHCYVTPRYAWLHYTQWHHSYATTRSPRLPNTQIHLVTLHPVTPQLRYNQVHYCYLTPRYVAPRYVAPRYVEVNHPPGRSRWGAPLDVLLPKQQPGPSDLAHVSCVHRSSTCFMCPSTNQEQEQGLTCGRGLSPLCLSTRPCGLEVLVLIAAPFCVCWCTASP